MKSISITLVEELSPQSRTLVLVLLAGTLLMGCRKAADAPVVKSAGVLDQPESPTPQQPGPSQDILEELEGRWKIVQHAVANISSVSDKEADQYMGKIAVIKGSGVLFEAALGMYDGTPCKFDRIEVSTLDGGDYIVNGFKANHIPFGLSDKKVREFETNCEGTAWSEFIKPDADSMVINFDGRLYLLKREERKS